MNERALERIENLLNVFNEREYTSGLTILGNHVVKVYIVRRNDGSFVVNDGEVFRDISELAMRVVDLISILGCREIYRLEYSIVRYNDSTTKFVYADVSMLI
jgi:hypothetical protein